MPLSHRLKQIEAERGEDASVFIPALLAEHGTPHKIAIVLGVYPNTIRNWLLNNGYQVENGVWTRTTEDKPDEDVPDEDDLIGELAPYG